MQFLTQAVHALSLFLGQFSEIMYIFISIQFILLVITCIMGWFKNV